MVGLLRNGVVIAAAAIATVGAVDAALRLDEALRSDWLTSEADNLGAIVGAIVAGLISVGVALLVVRLTVAPVWRQVDIATIPELQSTIRNIEIEINDFDEYTTENIERIVQVRDEFAEYRASRERTINDRNNPELWEDFAPRGTHCEHMIKYLKRENVDEIKLLRKFDEKRPSLIETISARQSLIDALMKASSAGEQINFGALPVGLYPEKELTPLLVAASEMLEAAALEVATAREKYRSAIKRELDASRYRLSVVYRRSILPRG